MAKPDLICRECIWRDDGPSRIKCRREVKVAFACNNEYLNKMISARSSGALSKDGLKCKYFIQR